MPNNNKRTITLSVDGKTYEDYRKYCEQKGIILSKQVEIFMQKELSKRGKKNED
jgi:hypothetical protein